METLYKKIDKYIYGGNYYLFIGKSFLFLSLVDMIINFSLVNFFGLPYPVNLYSERLVSENFILSFVSIVFIAPAVETFLFQWLPVFIYRSFVVNIDDRKDIIFSILISSLFGLLHDYSITYQISALVTGFLYVILSLFLENKRKNFFIPIFIVHLLNNLLVFLLKYIL